MDAPHGGEQVSPAEVSTSMSSVTPVHGVPDPDEDDLNDLDDLLDEFSSSRANADHDSAAEAHTSQHDLHVNGESSDAAADDFTQQLQSQMAALMGNGEESPEMRQEIQAILQELGAAVETTSTSTPPRPDKDQTTPQVATDESFQDAILRTMQRMQESGDKAHAEAAAGEDSDDILAQMLKEMQGGDPGAAAAEPEFSRMLMTMMEQLTNKDILYDPMKELNDKFPAWMSKNKPGVNADDLLRYEKQQKLIAEIVGKFEQRLYSDDNAEDREYIVKRMQEFTVNASCQMQAAGSPPADLVGDMSGAQSALQDMGSSCPQQ
ncbi:MAG: hypothetical protein Q9186_002352 [Xanthomendoza sp. 1 TL-2023]